MWILYVTTFCFVAGTAYIYLLITNKRSIVISDRLDGLNTAPRVDSMAAIGTRLDLSFVARALAPKSADDRKAFQDRFIQAGIYSQNALAWFFTLKLLLMIAPPTVGVCLGLAGWGSSTYGILAGAFIGCLGYFVPVLWLNWRIKKRLSAIKRSLPDFLDVMVVCLESGLSLQGSVSRVSEELGVAHPELANEMLVVQKDIELGATIDQALRRFAERSSSEEIKTLSSFMREATRFGTEVSEALRLNSEMLRTQRECDAEEMAQAAAVKVLAPTLLLIFPTVFVVIAGPAVIQILEAFSK